MSVDSRRSSQQIYNVTLFFLFFMSLYGLLGVQFFGELKNHCVLNTTNPKHITINSLAIPDTFCSTDPESGYQCPEGMTCMKLQLSKYIMGFNGFDEFGNNKTLHSTKIFFTAFAQINANNALHGSNFAS